MNSIDNNQPRNNRAHLIDSAAADRDRSIIKSAKLHSRWRRSCFHLNQTARARTK